MIDYITLEEHLILDFRRRHGLCTCKSQAMGEFIAEFPDPECQLPEHVTRRERWVREYRCCQELSEK